MSELEMEMGDAFAGGAAKKEGGGGAAKALVAGVVVAIVLLMLLTGGTEDELARDYRHIWLSFPTFASFTVGVWIHFFAGNWSRRPRTPLRAWRRYSFPTLLAVFACVFCRSFDGKMLQTAQTGSVDCSNPVAQAVLAGCGVSPPGSSSGSGGLGAGSVPGSDGSSSGSSGLGAGSVPGSGSPYRPDVTHTSNLALRRCVSAKQ